MRCRWITKFADPIEYCGRPAEFQTPEETPLCNDHAARAVREGWRGIRKPLAKPRHDHEPTSVTPSNGETLWFCATCGMPLTLTEVRLLDGDR